MLYWWSTLLWHHFVIILSLTTVLVWILEFLGLPYLNNWLKMRSLSVTVILVSSLFRLVRILIAWFTALIYLYNIHVFSPCTSLPLVLNVLRCLIIILFLVVTHLLILSFFWEWLLFSFFFLIACHTWRWQITLVMIFESLSLFRNKGASCLCSGDRFLKLDSVWRRDEL